MTMQTNILAAQVDRLGAIKAAIADLEAEEKMIKQSLVDSVRTGSPVIEGDLFKATVSFSQRETLDMKAVREHLSRQFIQAHTRVTDVTTVKVSSR